MNGAPAAGGDAAGLVDEITRGALEAGYFAGSILRAERGGKPLLEKAWGLSLDAPGEKRAMVPDCLFDLASITKLFTTTAILRLATTGALRLDEKLCDILGWSGSRLGDLLGKADIRSALAHATGLHYWYPFYARRAETFEAILERVVEEHPPRGETIYSDLNFMLLGKAVEAVCGLPLKSAMTELVFSPLGLRRSSYGEPLGEVAATEWGNRIEMGMVMDLGFSFDGWRETNAPIVGSPDDGNCHYYFADVAGHAGIFSDTRDLCRLGRLYLDDGAIGDGGSLAYLDPELAREACLDHGGERGLGFQLSDNYPSSGFGHGGFTGTYLYLNKKADIAVAILTNRLHVPGPRRIQDYTKAIVSAVLDSL